MTTIVDKTANGIIYRATETYPVPDVDILTLLFESETALANSQKSIHISAADPSLALSIARARTLTHATSSALRRHFDIGANGPGKDIVSVISTGHYLLPVLAYGIIGAGGVLSAASAASTPSELAKQIKGARSRVLIASEATKNVAVRAAEEAGWGKNGGGRVMVVGEKAECGLWVVGADGKLGANLVDEKQLLPWKKITNQQELEKSLVILIYSSGTTGLPKGVKLSHRNLVAETFIPGTMFKSWVTNHRPNFQYRTLAHLPTAHIAGIQGYLFNPFYHCGATYWMHSFSFPDFIRYNEQHAITFFFTVPPIYLLVAKSPEVTTQFRTAEYAISGAAPLGADLQSAAAAKLGCPISQTWGLSETTGSATLMPMHINDTTGSVSPLLPNMAARIVDENDADVAPGDPGEILIKGPVVCQGYFENAAANAESFIDGWFRTGDIAVFRNGLFYIVDRKKELIKYKGLQVAPAELEALLLSHPAVLDAAVIGVEVEGGNEVPRAYVVRKGGSEGEKLGEEEVKEWVKERVAGYKQLRGGVVFVDAVPKSPSGKILRKDLRALVAREKGGKAKL